MRVLLIDALGVVENVLELDSLATAQALYGDSLCVESPGDVGPGFTTADGGVTFAAPPTPTRTSRVSKLGFIHRMTDAEFVGILTAAQSNMPLAGWVKKLDMITPESDGTSLDLADAQVISGVTMLERAGLIAPGRAAEILKV